MDSTRERILERIDYDKFYGSHLQKYHPNGDGQATALCPFHDDHDPSFSVNVADRAKQGAWQCFGACNDKGDVFHFAARIYGTDRDFPETLSRLATEIGIAPDAPAPKSARRVVATYPYRDEHGVLLFEVVRYDPKSFLQRRPDGKGGWLWNMNGVPRVLYKLPELLASDPAAWCFITEGERDVESLASIGVTATCNPGGAGKWGRLSDDSALHGRRVCIVSDKDEPGRLHAADVAWRLAGKAAMVKVIELPGEGVKDATDWLDAHDAQEWEDLRAELLRLADAAPAGIPDDPPDDAAPARHSPLSAGALLAKYPTLRDPVIGELLRRGELMNIIAPPKTGKSWLALDLALAVATGRRWLEFDTTQGRVLLLDNELHAATLANRLRRVVDARKIPPGDYADRLLIDTCRGKGLDIFALQEYFADVAPETYRLIIIDAFYRFLPVGIDENSNADLTSLYNKLDTLAEQLQCSFVLIHHSSKGPQAAKSLVDVGAGAGAMSRATDTHVILRQHQEEGVVVLEAAVRSFPPVNPTCLRWTFPTWQVEPELDAAKLAEGRRKKPDKPADEAKPERASITPEKFVEAFVTAKPRTKAEIIIAADAAHVPERKAQMMFTAAGAQGLIYPWTDPNDRRKLSFATQPQPVLAPEAKR